MKPITPQQIVHLRLSSTLPVRTHYRPADAVPGGNVHYMTPIEATERKKRIRAMKRQGITTNEIARIEGVSKQTVYNHLRRR
jgi:DNA invertase Pin-like site-specific DNA recombinase